MLICNIYSEVFEFSTTESLQVTNIKQIMILLTKIATLVELK